MSKNISIRISDELLEKLNMVRGSVPLGKFVKDILNDTVCGKAKKIVEDTTEFVGKIRAIDMKTTKANEKIEDIIYQTRRMNIFLNELHRAGNPKEAETFLRKVDDITRKGNFTTL